MNLHLISDKCTCHLVQVHSCLKFKLENVRQMPFCLFLQKSNLQVWWAMKYQKYRNIFSIFSSDRSYSNAYLCPSVFVAQVYLELVQNLTYLGDSSSESVLIPNTSSCLFINLQVYFLIVNTDLNPLNTYNPIVKTANKQMCVINSQQ